MGLIKDLFPNVFELMPKVTRAPHDEALLISECPLPTPIALMILITSTTPS